MEELSNICLSLKELHLFLQLAIDVHDNIPNWAGTVCTLEGNY